MTTLERAAGERPLKPVRLPPEWHAPLMRLAIAWGALIMLFLDDWRDMFAQWWGSSTYNHVLLIPLILGWLVAQRLDEVLRLRPQGWWPGLVVFAGAGFLWLLGDFAGLSLARQLGVVVMAQAALATLLGPRLIAGLLFPLFYMLFLVPAGDEIIPLLQTLTARITMVLLHLTQIPAQIDGVFITTPAGYFEVAEACSGVKFLIAMIAYGALVANVCFLSWRRRLAFMAVSFVVPVFANGARAWGTIFIAGKVGVQFASSFDHVFYGWVFFAVVMAVAMGVGWFFFDRAPQDPMIDVAAIEASPVIRWAERWRLGPGTGLAALALIAALYLGWGAIANRIEAPLPATIAVPAIPGWHRVAVTGTPMWQPLHTGASRRLRQRFADAAGNEIELSFALYPAQGEGREAGGFGQGTLTPETVWAWEAPGPTFDGARSDVIQAPVPGSDQPVHLLAVTWYRSGPLLTGSNLALKLSGMADRLLLRRRTTMVLILSAREGQGIPAAALITAFQSATGPVAAWMDRIAKQK